MVLTGLALVGPLNMNFPFRGWQVLSVCYQLYRMALAALEWLDGTLVRVCGHQNSHLRCMVALRLLY